MTDPAHKEKHSSIGGSLKEAVFGFNDGVVSTFAVIAGLTGGLVEQKTVLLGALATLIAGAFSMGLGTYLGSKSEKDLYEKERKREIYEMKYMPEIETQEVREIFEAKGFKGELLEKAVAKITSNREVWLQTMMQEELGFAQSPPTPWLDGIVMSIAFTRGSVMPTLPYFFRSGGAAKWLNMPTGFWISLGLSIIGLLFVGAFKTKFTGKNIAISALETLGVGTLAAAGSFAIGLLFNVGVA
ncbi:MAG: VIT1/CCC1 transporter family protein [Candidatus Gracilibacteria bacterium]